MAFFCIGGLCFWPPILTLYLTSVTSIFVNCEVEAPKTLWVDQSCLLKGFTSATVQESLNIATQGASRLLNLNDRYQGLVYQLLFKVARDFNVETDEETAAWLVVGKQLPVLLFGMNVDVLNHLQEDLGWIGAMTLGNNRDNADVRVLNIYFPVSRKKSSV